MTDDPLFQIALDALNDLAGRYTKLGCALTAVAESFQSEHGQPASPPEIAQEAEVRWPDPRLSLVVESFHARLSEVYGVTRVTVDEAGPERYHFLVEMADPEPIPHAHQDPDHEPKHLT